MGWVCGCFVFRPPRAEGGGGEEEEGGGGGGVQGRHGFYFVYPCFVSVQCPWCMYDECLICVFVSAFDACAPVRRRVHIYVVSAAAYRV